MLPVHADMGKYISNRIGMVKFQILDKGNIQWIFLLFLRVGTHLFASKSILWAFTGIAAAR